MSAGEPSVWLSDAVSTALFCALLIVAFPHSLYQAHAVPPVYIRTYTILKDIVENIINNKEVSKKLIRHMS